MFKIAHVCRLHVELLILLLQHLQILIQLNPLLSHDLTLHPQQRLYTQISQSLCKNLHLARPTEQFYARIVLCLSSPLTWWSYPYRTLQYCRPSLISATASTVESHGTPFSPAAISISPSLRPACTPFSTNAPARHSAYTSVTSADSSIPPQTSSLATKLTFTRVIAAFQLASTRSVANEFCSSRCALVNAKVPHTHAFSCEYALVSPHPCSCAF